MAIDPFLVSLALLTVAIIAGIVYLVLSRQESRGSQSVEMRVVMEGDAASVTTQDRDAMRRTFALKGGVRPSQVDVEVSSGSIVVDFRAWTDDATEVSSRLSNVQSQEWQAAFQQESTFPVKIVRVTQPTVSGGKNGNEAGDGDEAGGGNQAGDGDEAGEGFDYEYEVGDTSSRPQGPPNWYESTLREDFSGSRSVTVPHLTEALFVTMPFDPLKAGDEFDVFAFANITLDNTKNECTIQGQQQTCELYQFDIEMTYDDKLVTYVSSSMSNHFEQTAAYLERFPKVQHTVNDINSNFPSPQYQDERRGMFFLVKYRMRVKNDVEPGVKRVLDFKIINYTLSRILNGDAHKSEDARILDHRDSSVTPNRSGEIIIVAGDDGADDAVDGCWVGDTTPLPERQPNWYDSSLRHDCSGPRSAKVPHLTEPLFVTMPTDPLLPDEEFDVLLFANTALSNTQYDCGDIVCELYGFDIFMEYDTSALTFVSSATSDYYNGASESHYDYPMDDVHDFDDRMSKYPPFTNSSGNASATVRHTAIGLSSRYPSPAYADDRRGMFFLIKYRMRVKGGLSAGVKSSVFGVRVGTFAGNDQLDTRMTPSGSNKDARVLDYRDSLLERQIKGDIEVA